MQKTIVRLENIHIENFKNITNGKLCFSNNKENYKANILGLFGPNGSGKTTLVDAIELLQLALKGVPIPQKFADFINVEAESARLCYEFSVSDQNRKHLVFYEFKLTAEKDESTQNMPIPIYSNEKIFLKAVIKNEILSYTYENNQAKTHKNILIDTASSKTSEPFRKFPCFIKENEETVIELLANKKIAQKSSRSFLFSKELLEAIRNNQENQNNPDHRRYLTLIENLIYYGNHKLFVINSAGSNNLYINMLPLLSSEKNIKKFFIPLDEEASISIKTALKTKRIISSINKVLPIVIPKLTISLEPLEEVLLKNGEKGIRLQLMSQKNQKAIPLKYESDGIKRIISIIPLLIAVYKHPSITAVIDGIDSNISEHILNKLLRIISEKGKGQLIFTLHNSLPLEILDNDSIAFTTTKPSNRYIIRDNI